MTIQSQICKTCSVEKPVDNFHFRNDTKKYRTVCKECWSQKGTKWSQSDRKKKQDERNKNKKPLTRKQINDRNYYQKHREQIIVQNGEFYKKNRDEILRNRCESDKEKRRIAREEKIQKRDEKRRLVLESGVLKCCMCKKSKPFDEFSVDPNYWTGRGRRCSECHNEYAKKFAQDNPEIMTARRKLYRAKHLAEVRIRERNKYNKRLQLNRQAPPEEKITTKRWIKLCESWNWSCAYCSGICYDPTIDHVQPISKDGQDYISNVLPACKKCNSSKHCKTLIEWKGLVPVIDTHKDGFKFISRLIKA